MPASEDGVSTELRYTDPFGKSLQAIMNADKNLPHQLELEVREIKES